MIGRPPVPLADRFWLKVEKTETCWLWRGAITKFGYGQTSDRGRSIPAHRAAYELEVAPIPEGLHLDHLCRVRNCVRPDHLEPVTPRVNLLRGQTNAAANAAKTECPQGHPYDEENTRFDKRRGIRHCKECGRRRTREWRQRQVEAGAA